MNTTPNTPHIEPICTASRLSNAIVCCNDNDEFNEVALAYTPEVEAHGWCGPESPTSGEILFLGFKDDSCVLIDFTGGNYVGHCASDSVRHLCEGAAADPEVPVRIKRTLALMLLVAMERRDTTQPEADLQPGKAKG